MDGVLASCYASLDHDLAHFIMTPMQWFPEVLEWIFNVDKGFQGYVIIAKELGGWLMPHATEVTSVNKYGA